MPELHNRRCSGASLHDPEARRHQSRQRAALHGRSDVQETDVVQASQVLVRQLEMRYIKLGVANSIELYINERMTTTDTERKYKQGFIREDGRVFHSYQKRKNGTLRESWMTPEAFSNYRCKARQWIKDNPERHRENVARSLDKRSQERFPNSSEITRQTLIANVSIDEQLANVKRMQMNSAAVIQRCIAAK